MEPRTTLDLIEELDAEAPKFTHVLLVVGFEHTTIFVMNGDANRLAVLNDAIEAGGNPTGLIGLKLHNGQATFYSRVLQEYAEEGWAIRYLHALIVKAAEILQQTRFESRNGWLN
jgi:hypothetical protein